MQPVMVWLEGRVWGYWQARDEAEGTSATPTHSNIIKKN